MSDVQGAQSVLEEWIGEALEEHTLPSGRQVRLRAGSLMELAMTGLLPAPLMAVVLKEAPSSSLSDTRVAMDLTRDAVERSAASIRAVKSNAGEWIPVTIDAATFLELPSPDREAITRIALGEEYSEVTASLATFRDDGRRDGAGDHGADVRPAAVEPPGSNRAARRAGDRSRPRQSTRG